LLPGETLRYIIHEIGFHLNEENRTVIGTLYITSFRLEFIWDEHPRQHRDSILWGNGGNVLSEKSSSSLQAEKDPSIRSIQMSHSSVYTSNASSNQGHSPDPSGSTLHPKQYIIMLPICHVLKIEEKRLTNHPRGPITEIVVRSKHAQKFVWKDFGFNPSAGGRHTQIYNCKEKKLMLSVMGNSFTGIGESTSSLSQSIYGGSNSFLFTLLAGLTIDRCINTTPKQSTVFAFQLREHNDKKYKKMIRTRDVQMRRTEGGSDGAATLAAGESPRSVESPRQETPQATPNPLFHSYPEIQPQRTLNLPSVQQISYGFPSERLPMGFPIFSPSEIEEAFLLYDSVTEFQRQGAIGVENPKWRISTVNENYELSDSYPKLICVPIQITDAILLECAKFRSRGRIPVLTWRHPTNGACIARSSQPLTGLTRAHSVADAEVISAIRQSSNSDNLVFLDARPKTNAYGNVLCGKGFENVARYENTSLEFMNIENIHAMTSSLNTLARLCHKRDQENWLANLDSSLWIKHTRALLKATMRIIELVEDEHTPVLFRCSCGWDRTAQNPALAAMCMDPFYRTIKGFEILIEKDWLSFGHKFKDRNGLYQVDSEFSPIFFQFIDCVHQIWSQHPDCFEFNENFLLCLTEHCYSGLFGTFLQNSDKERELRTSFSFCKTIPLWAYVNHPTLQPLMLNDLYDPSTSVKRVVIRPSSDLATLTKNFWTAQFFQRSENKLTNLFRQRIDSLVQSNKEMMQRLKKEEKRRREFQSKYRKAKEVMKKDGQGSAQDRGTPNHTDDTISETDSESLEDVSPSSAALPKEGPSFQFSGRSLNLISDFFPLGKGKPGGKPVAT